MHHVLKAYVFVRIPPKTNEKDSNFAISREAKLKKREIGSGFLRLVTVVLSPKFTVISYRRAPNEATTLKMDHTLCLPTPIPPSSAPATSDSVSHKRFFGQDYPSISSQDTPSSSKEDTELEHKRRRRRQSSLSESVVKSLSITSDLNYSKLFVEKVLWEHAHGDAVATSKNLCLLYLFVQWTPISSHNWAFENLAQCVNRQHLQDLAHPFRHVADINGISKLFMDSTARVCPYQSSGARMHGFLMPSSAHCQEFSIPPNTPELKALIQVTTQIVLWFHSNENLMWMREFINQRFATTCHKQLLRKSFVTFLALFEKRLQRDVLLNSAFQSLAQITEEITSAVYIHRYYASKRAWVREVMSHPGFIGWHAFVAQVRDVYIANSIQTRLSLFGETSPWHGVWLMHFESFSWKPSEETSVPHFSLFQVLEWLSHLGRIEVALNASNYALWIRSTQNLVSEKNGGMLLILDGKDRVFRLLPNGKSTFMGKADIGDYRGFMTYQTPSTRGRCSSQQIVVSMQCYCWAPYGIDQFSFQTRWQMICTVVNGTSQITVNGSVLYARTLGFFNDCDTTEMRLSEKLRRLENKGHLSPLNPSNQHTHLCEPAKGIPSSRQEHFLWHELASFDFSYQLVT